MAEKRQPLRLELPAHLERRDEVIEPVDVPQESKKIGEAITEVIIYEPASSFVRRIIRPKFIAQLTIGVGSAQHAIYWRQCMILYKAKYSHRII